MHHPLPTGEQVREFFSQFQEPSLQSDQPLLQEGLSDFAHLHSLLTRWPTASLRYQGWSNARRSLLTLPHVSHLISSQELLLQFLNLFDEAHRYACLEKIKTCVLQLVHQNNKDRDAKEVKKVRHIMAVMDLLPLKDKIKFVLWFTEEIPQIYKNIVNNSLATLILLLQAHASEAEKQWFLTVFDEQDLLGWLATGNEDEVADILALLPDSILHVEGLNFSRCLEELSRFKVMQDINFISLFTILKKLPGDRQSRVIGAVEKTVSPMVAIIKKATWVIPKQKESRLQTREMMDDEFSLPTRVYAVHDGSPVKERPEAQVRWRPSKKAVDAGSLIPLLGMASPLGEIKRSLSSSSSLAASPSPSLLPKEAIDLTQLCEQNTQHVRVLQGMIYHVDILFALLDQLKTPGDGVSEQAFSWVCSCLTLEYIPKIITRVDLLHRMINFITEADQVNCIELLGVERVQKICESGDPPLIFLQLMPSSFISALLPDIQQFLKTLMKCRDINEVKNFIYSLHQRDLLWSMVFKEKVEAKSKGKEVGETQPSVTPHKVEEYKVQVAAAMGEIEKYKMTHPWHSQLALSAVVLAFRELAFVVRQSSQSRKSFSPSSNSNKVDKLIIADKLSHLLMQNVTVQERIAEASGQLEEVAPEVLQEEYKPILTRRLLGMIFPQVAAVLCLPAEAELRKQLEMLSQRRAILPIIWLFMAELSCKFEAYSAPGADRFRAGKMLFSFMQDKKKTDQELTSSLKAEQLDRLVVGKDKLGIIYDRCLILSKPS